MIHTESLEIRTRGAGSWSVTEPVAAVVARSGVRTGLCSVFCLHTSASLLITEKADPAVRTDLEAWLARLAPEGDPRYRHVEEGPDDMPSHLRSAVTRTSETIHIDDGALTLGTWQGLYLLEHRRAPHVRRLRVRVVGE